MPDSRPGQRPTATTLYEERRPKVVRLAGHYAAQGQSIHIREGVKLLGLNPRAVEDLYARMVQEGHLVRLAYKKDGWTVPPIAMESPSPTLARLVGEARSCTRADTVARRGRQPDDASRDLHSLTPTQLGDIERLANLILLHMPAAEGDPDRVRGGVFDWLPDTSKEGGHWALRDLARKWILEDHRESHERRQPKKGQQRARWNERMADASVRKYEAAASNLLNLAATKGLIARSPLIQPGADALYHPDWIAPLRSFSDFLERAGRCGSMWRFQKGARVLARYASRRGELSLRSTRWLDLRAEILNDQRVGRIKRSDFENARYAWRESVRYLRRYGVKLGVDFAWADARPVRTTLVPKAAIDTAAAIDVSPKDRDFSGWIQADGRFATGLVEGRWGLRSFAAWSTLPEDRLATAVPPLPPREWARESIFGRRRKKNRRPRRIRYSTLALRLRVIAQAAAYLEDQQSFDWTQSDLRAVCNPTNVRAMLSWMSTLPEDPRGDRATHRRIIVVTLAWLCNSFISGVAKQEFDEALATGDMALIEAARQQVETFATWYRELEEYLDRMPVPRHRTVEGCYEQNIAIAEAWRGSDGVDGLSKVTRLIDCLVGEACEHAGGLTIEQQIAAIETREFVPNPSWAASVRLAVALLLLQRIPLRGRTVAQLTTEMWVNAAVGVAQQGRRLAVWEGAISLSIDGEYMKSGRPFNPNFIKASHVNTRDRPGSERHETAVRRDLLKLYFCSGGARDFCSTSGSVGGEPLMAYDDPWVFPDRLCPTTHPEGRAIEEGLLEGQWSRGALSRAFRSAVLRHADTLGIDATTIVKVRGALGIHALRKLFGTKWAPINPVACCRMLDHIDPGFTARLYCAQDERTMTLDVAADAAEETTKLAKAEAEVDLLRDQLRAKAVEHAQLVQQIAALNASVTLLATRAA